MSEPTPEGSDDTMRRHIGAVHQFPRRQPSMGERLKSFWSLGVVVLAILTLGAIGKGWTARVESAEKKNAEQDGKLGELDAAKDLEFEARVRITAKVEALEKHAEWSNDTLWRMARDQGLRVQPPPTHEASPAPKATP